MSGPLPLLFVHSNRSALFSQHNRLCRLFLFCHITLSVCLALLSLLVCFQLAFPHNTGWCHILCLYYCLQLCDLGRFFHHTELGTVSPLCIPPIDPSQQRCGRDNCHHPCYGSSPSSNKDG